MIGKALYENWKKNKEREKEQRDAKLRAEGKAEAINEIANLAEASKGQIAEQVIKKYRDQIKRDLEVIKDTTKD